MTLPAITPYPLPLPEHLPANRASWRIDPARAVLLVHDMQRYFLRPYPDGADPLRGALANIAALTDACRAARIPVCYTAKPGGMDPEQRGLERHFWGGGMRAAAEHTAIDERVAPDAADVVVTKSRYSAFVGTDLAARMAGQGRDQLVVTGVYAHIGCLLTAADAFMRDIQPFFVADATADFTADDHRFALEYAAGRCAVVTSTDRVLAAVGAARIDVSTGG
ncbi:isochorismatase family protein [Thermobifida halotolerans]|uniref:Isochorismatase family protein n=1 Tax=Thermobifida halotolerans TaxID=483545 RepID=A0A399G9R2_9ACTN|nr:isochorismatase family protein [Thermobifida halotolerans]UOE21651.1 isochorismatase family protein [Thermobifida halotolerans]